MKEKEYTGLKFVRRIAGYLIFAMFFLVVSAGIVIFSAEETQAASVSKKTVKIKLADSSGRYLLDTGYNWWLKDKNGKRVGGFNYIRVPAGKGLNSGYYMFDSRGRLCKEKHFHKVDAVVSGKKFKGTFYFGGKNGSLYCRRGWVSIGGKKYLLTSYGKRYENCWRYGYYLQADGTIARSRKLPDGSYVDFEGRKCTRQDMALNGLKKKLSQMLAGYSGSWSVYVKDLKSGAVINLNDQEMYPASTIKAFVMASTFDQIQKGRLKYNADVKELLTDMITVSDNEACNQLIRYNSKSRSFLDGTRTINRYLSANKYTETGCHHSLHPAASSYVGDGMSNVSSAKDCGLLLERIYNGTCVSPRYSRTMLNLLLKQTRRWKIPSGLPSGVKVANKTGETSSVDHDMAIVFGKKTDYVLCVFSRTGSEGYAIPRIQNISGTVYKYLNK